MPEEDATTMRELVDRFQAADRERNVDEVVALFTDDVVRESVGGASIRGKGSYVEGLRAFYGAFSDYHLELEEVLIDGDVVVMLQRWTGVHSGEGFGPPATGRRVDDRLCIVATVEAGRFAHALAYEDPSALAAQLSGTVVVGAHPPSAGPADAPSSVTSLAVIQKVLDAVVQADNAHDTERLLEFYRDDVQLEGPGGPSSTGKADFRAYAQAFYEAFPDYRIELQRTLIDRNVAVTLLRSQGTNLGSFMGAEPTGKAVELRFCIAWWFRDGLVARRRTYMNTGALAAQLA